MLIPPIIIMFEEKKQKIRILMEIIDRWPKSDFVIFLSQLSVSEDSFFSSYSPILTLSKEQQYSLRFFQTFSCWKCVTCFNWSHCSYKLQNIVWFTFKLLGSQKKQVTVNSIWLFLALSLNPPFVKQCLL